MPPGVLVVDDSDFMRNLLCEILSEEFEVVAEAENGVEAVDRYRECDPDLVLMDILMPIRDGIEATREITAADPGANVVMCTCVGEEAEMKRAVAAGADGYITKPFQKPNVLEAIDDVLQREE